jgi:hypothetical protein
LIHCVKIKKFFVKDLLDGSREARFFCEAICLFFLIAGRTSLDPLNQKVLDPKSIINIKFIKFKGTLFGCAKSS